MNRFEYARSVASVDETIVAKCKGIKLYNGDQKVDRPLNQLVQPRRFAARYNNLPFL